jgi:uroporphyrinogen decarboxylase
MKEFQGLLRPVKIDCEGLISNLRREGTPDRVYNMELFQDGEISDAIAERYDVYTGIDPADPHCSKKQHIAMQRFCGFDTVRVNLEDMEWPLFRQTTDDTADLRRASGRHFQDEHTGPITNWEEYERYPWPDPTAPSTVRSLEWYQKNLPDDMCISSGSMSHFCEFVTWLMGYETFCYALFDQRDLVTAIVDKLTDIYAKVLEQYLSFDKLKIVFASDDMGYKTGLLFSAEDMIEFVLKPHKRMAARTREAGRLYLLHACGRLDEIVDYLTDEIHIDGKHSFEDTIEDVREVKHTYGRKTSLIGGIDVDFLCRADEEQIRARVRDTLETCLPGGGYCLGSGNSVANYIPLDSYLAMVDEGRLYGG